MRGKDVAKLALVSTNETTMMFLSDLADADFLSRPVPSANHIAWQLAHLIVAEKMLLEGFLPEVVYPEIPAGIVALGNDRSGKLEPDGSVTKASLLDTMKKMRAATIAAVDKLSDDALDIPNTKIMQEFAPNLGAMLILVANHTLMHGGQFTVVRRALGKPVVF